MLDTQFGCCPSFNCFIHPSRLHNSVQVDESQLSNLCMLAQAVQLPAVGVTLFCTLSLTWKNEMTKALPSCISTVAVKLCWPVHKGRAGGDVTGDETLLGCQSRVRHRHRFEMPCFSLALQAQFAHQHVCRDSALPQLLVHSVFSAPCSFFSITCP
jgi:hypothetical protein